MPYVAKGKCVYKRDTGKKVGCTKGPVSKYLAALHANADEGVQKEAYDTKMAPPLKISDLIKKLNEAKAKYGDVYVWDRNSGDVVNGVFPQHSGVVITPHMHIRDDEPMQETTQPSNITINGKPVDMGSIELEDVDPRDYPDFSDAYIAAASFEDGTPLTDQECEQLNQEHGDIVNDLAHESLHEQQQAEPIKLTEMLKRLQK